MKTKLLIVVAAFSLTGCAGLDVDQIATAFGEGLRDGVQGNYDRQMTNITGRYHTTQRIKTPSGEYKYQVRGNTYEITKVQKVYAGQAESDLQKRCFANPNSDGCEKYRPKSQDEVLNDYCNETLVKYPSIYKDWGACIIGADKSFRNARPNWK